MCIRDRWRRGPLLLLRTKMPGESARGCSNDPTHKESSCFSAGARRVKAWGARLRRRAQKKPRSLRRRMPGWKVQTHGGGHGHRENPCFSAQRRRADAGARRHCGAEAVSYTHLDVYKRQSRFSANESHLPCGGCPPPYVRTRRRTGGAVLPHKTDRARRDIRRGGGPVGPSSDRAACCAPSVLSRQAVFPKGVCTAGTGPPAQTNFCF